MRASNQLVLINFTFHRKIKHPEVGVFSKRTATAKSFIPSLIRSFLQSYCPTSPGRSSCFFPFQVSGNAVSLIPCVRTSFSLKSQSYPFSSSPSIFFDYHRSISFRNVRNPILSRNYVLIRYENSLVLLLDRTGLI